MFVCLLLLSSSTLLFRLGGGRRGCAGRRPHLSALGDVPGLRHTKRLRSERFKIRPDFPNKPGDRP